MDSDIDWNAPAISPPSGHRRVLDRPRSITVILLAIVASIAVVWIRGICWEALLGVVIVLAFALAMLRPPLSVWLATVLALIALGSVGLIGWSGLRFHSLNVFSSYSPRLTVCERDYQPAGSLREKLPAPFHDLTRHVMGVTPSGSAILGVGCQTTVLFVESPGPKYQPYDLLGGP